MLEVQWAGTVQLFANSFLDYIKWEFIKGPDLGLF